MTLPDEHLQDRPIDEEEEEEDDADDLEESEVEDEDEDEDEAEVERAKMERVAHRISTQRVPLRVHDVIIKGNAKTKDSVIDAEAMPLRAATSVQELMMAAALVNGRLRNLDIFDAVKIGFNAGPPELPGTTNVVIEVVETQSPLTGNIGVFSKPEAKSWSLEGSLKLKNLLGLGDLWDGSLAYSWDHTSEVSAGVSLPRFKRFRTPVLARASLLSQDWLKFSSYKERALGLSLGLISSKNHDLAYNLSWRTLSDPSQMASRSVRRQLGHSLVSSLKYTFKIDKRNNFMRPTRGYAFVSTSHIGGLIPDYRGLRFLRQEFDVRYAVPLGFYNAALNFGVSCGINVPWGSGFLNMPSSLPERFFLGGSASPVCTLGGPAALLGFKSRGVGPTEPRRQLKGNPNEESSTENSLERDFVGGDLALTTFADLSFDFPLRVLRESGIHGHLFACAGNLTKLSENSYQDFSFQTFRDSFRSSAGFGIIVPTKIFRMEVNYCYILKQLEHDRGKTGVQFSFSSPLSL